MATQLEFIELFYKDDDKDVLKAIKKLEVTHKEAIRVYDPHDGEDNKLRYTVCSYDFHLFPSKPENNLQGYLEDRRPSSNCDPYQVTRMIAESILLR
uniref:DUF4242 domain-containing protein n=1 Tax=Angiostrongylus cantonensis TaxID=6313 RepID=A0A0K0CXI2_ANGCA